MVSTNCDSVSTPISVVSGGGGIWKTFDQMEKDQSIQYASSFTPGSQYDSSQGQAVPLRYGDQIYLKIAQASKSGITYGTADRYYTDDYLAVGITSADLNKLNAYSISSGSVLTFVVDYADPATNMPATSYRGQYVQYNDPVYLTATNGLGDSVCPTSLVGWGTTVSTSTDDDDFDPYLLKSDNPQVAISTGANYPAFNVYNGLIYHSFQQADDGIAGRQYVCYGDTMFVTSSASATSADTVYNWKIHRGSTTDFEVVSSGLSSISADDVLVLQPLAVKGSGITSSGVVPLFSAAVNSTLPTPPPTATGCINLPDNSTNPTKWVQPTSCTSQSITCVDSTAGCDTGDNGGSPTSSCVQNGCEPGNVCCGGDAPEGSICVASEGGGCKWQNCVNDLKCKSANNKCCSTTDSKGNVTYGCPAGQTCQFNATLSKCQCMGTPTNTGGNTSWIAIIILGLLALLAFFFLWF